VTFQENIYYQKRKGFLDANVYTAWEEDFKVWAERRHLDLRWKEIKQFYHPDFRHYVSEIIKDIKEARAQ
jgi:hypothetical protein